MKLWAVKTYDGMMPATDDDHDKWQQLSPGKVYACEIRDGRNYRFHCLYFSLIRCAWDLLPEFQREFYHDSPEAFRKAVEVAAGYYDLCWSYTRQEWLECPRSIAFDKLPEGEFHTLYERVKDTLYTLLIDQGLDIETIDNQLKNY